MFFLNDQDGYRTKDPNRRLKKEVRDEIDISLFDEKDPRQHQTKMIFGMELIFGLQGNKEYCELCIRNITYRIFPKKHPFAGYKYIGIRGFHLCFVFL